MVRQPNSCNASILECLQYPCIGDVGYWTVCNYTILGNTIPYVWELQCLDIGMAIVFETIILASSVMVPMGDQSSGHVGVHLPLPKPMVSHWFLHTTFKHTSFEWYLAHPAISCKSTIFQCSNTQTFYSLWHLIMLMSRIINSRTCQCCNIQRS